MIFDDDQEGDDLFEDTLEISTAKIPVFTAKYSVGQELKQQGAIRILGG